MAKIQVLGVRIDGRNQTVAHCKFNEMFGDVLALPTVTEPGIYELKITVKVQDGRLVPMMRVEP